MAASFSSSMRTQTNHSSKPIRPIAKKPKRATSAKATRLAISQPRAATARAIVRPCIALLRPERAGRLQRGYARLVVADLGQHLVVVLADLRWIADQRRPPAQHLERQ